MLSDISVLIMTLFCFNHDPEVRGMLLVAIYKFFFGRTMSMERRKGSNKVLYRDALAQGQRPIHFTGFRQERRSFHTYSCTSSF